MNFIAHHSLSLAALMILPSLAQANVQNQDLVEGGDVRFQGAVVSSACAVSAESQNLTVVMGQVRSNAFHGLGSWADPQNFSLKLVGCDPSVSQRVGVVFRGLTDGKDPGVLAIPEGAQSAKGIGVGIFDSKGNQIYLNSQPVSFARVEENTVVLHFVAKYRATSASVIAGYANAQAWFTLTYL